MLHKKLVKKISIIVLSVLLLVIATLLIVPYFFKKDIQNAVVQLVENQIDAKISFSDLDLSLIYSFPNLRLSLTDFQVSGLGAFSKDTLCLAKEFDAEIDLISVWKGEKYQVNRITIKSPKIYAHILKNGKANWEIFKEENPEDEADKDAFLLRLEKLKIKDADVTVWNEQKSILFTVESLNHELSGNFSEKTTDISTENNWKNVVFSVKDMTYLNHVDLALDGDIAADFEREKYTLENDELQINAICLLLNGTVDNQPKSVTVDVKASSNNVQFKDVLSLIPALYTKDFADIETEGNVQLSAFAKGDFAKNHVPQFGLDVAISDAKFQYPSLPKSVDKINIKGRVTNNEGPIDSLKIDVSDFSFEMGENPFVGNFSLCDLWGNMQINGAANGRINLGMIKDIYPLPDSIKLSGIADLNLKLSGKMSYYEKKEYEKIVFSGGLILSQMNVDVPSLSQPLKIKNADFSFEPKHVGIKKLEMQIGKSDINGSGYLDNFIPYVFRNDTLSGSMTINSKLLDINDLITNVNDYRTKKNTVVLPQKEKSMEVLILPKNLRFNLFSSFKKIVMDSISLQNVIGNLRMSDSQLFMSHLSLCGMGGTMTANGSYSSKNILQPTLQMNFDIKDVLYSEVFRQVETAKILVPIFGKTTGRFSSTLSVSTAFKDGMKPDVETFVAEGVLSSKNITISNVKALHFVSKTLKRDEFYDPEIHSVSIPFRIQKGVVYTDAFDFYIADTKVKVEAGSTSIDEKINYVLRIDEPCSEGTVFKLNKLAVKMGGTFSNPTVKIATNEMFSEAVSTVKKQASANIKEAATSVKTQFREMKEDSEMDDLKSEFKEAGQNIREGFRNLFKRNDDEE